MQNVTRREFLKAIGVGAVSLAGPGAFAAAAGGRRPNIIVFMPDDIGYEALGCYGSAVYKTPVLDKLAATGMRINHCHAQPLCTPTRVKIMTGKYNCRNYIRFGLLDTKETTFAQILRKAGYATGIAGKWQLGGDGETVKRFGFDRHCLWHITGRNGRYWKPRLMHDGKVVTHPAEKYGPDIVCDFALDFIERSKDGPFLLYYPMILTHWPFDPTPDSADGGSKKKHVSYNDSGKPGQEYFKDMVAYMDKIVGRIVAKLDELKLREDTLILFTGDNGTSQVKGRMKDGRVIGGGKGSMTDDGTRVALIANWPGKIAPKQVSDALVDFTDFLPTVAEAARAEVPGGLQLDGKSFLPVLLGRKKHVREWIFCHYNPRPKREPTAPAAREKALRQVDVGRTRHKLGRWARTQRYKLYGTGQFYDVAADPDEQKDIKAGSGSAEAEAARKMLQSVHDAMPPWQPFARGGAKSKAGKASRKAGRGQ